jgi:5-methylthioadenosine/S-adenosylhomocysteine deaminase
MPDTSIFKIIRGGYVVDSGSHQAEPTDVLIEGNRIAALIPPGAAVPEGAQPIDAYDRLLVPGLINAHTHSHGGLAKGMGDRWTLELLLHAGPWLSGSRTLDHLYLSSLIGALEMVRKGCTACYDLYLELPIPTPEGLDAIARAYQEAGHRRPNDSESHVLSGYPRPP